MRWRVACKQCKLDNSHTVGQKDPGLAIAVQASGEDAGENFETTTNLDTVYQKELAPRA